MISPKTSLLLILVIICSGSVWAQENELEQSSYPPYRVAVYGSVGYFFLYGSLNVNVEGKVWQSTRMPGKSFWIKASAGGWVSFFSYEDGGPSYLLGGVYLTGKSDHFFEAMLGATYFYNRITYNAMLTEYEGERDSNPDFDASYYSEPQKSTYIHIFPAGSAGYRYQPSEGHFIFRAGIGFPDAIYISLGLSI